MTEFYRDPLATVYQGDCCYMTEIPDNSVHCAVTSPPYWGLRRYKGLEDLIWGGKPDCRHEWIEVIKPASSGSQTFMPDGGCQTQTMSATHEKQLSNSCSLCGAWRGQLGSEPTIELYISHMLEVFREVKRVLRPDGVFWLNIGDSMSASGQGGGGNSFQDDRADIGQQRRHAVIGLKPLDACLIPFRIALALQADGWYVRADIIWNKNNPMPESVNGWRWEKHRIKVKESKRDPNKASEMEHPPGDSRHNPESAAIFEDCPGCPKCKPNDGLVLRQGSWRPTNAHEYIFMLTKTDLYYADREAVKEGDQVWVRKAGQPKAEDAFDGDYKGIRGFGKYETTTTGRNLRSVWTFPTQGYAGAHFATFCPELPLRCIKASTSEVGVCSKCGKQWARVIESKQPPEQLYTETSNPNDGQVRGHRRNGVFCGAGQKVQDWIDENPAQTLGWRPSCKCNAPVVPAIVLDPFAGSGTTLAVAKSLGHIGIGYELSSEYLPMIKRRLEETPAGQLSSQLKMI